MVLMLVIGVLGAMLVGLARPRAILAATVDGQDDIVMVRDHKLSINDLNDYNYMVDGNTGRVLYCIRPNDSQPAQGDALESGGEISAVTGEGDDILPFSGVDEDGDRTPRVALMTRAFDYIAYHGYSGDESITIGDLTGDKDSLYLATQLAIDYVIDPGSRHTRSSIDDPVITDSIIEAATVLYDQAVAYARSGEDGIEAHTSIWYQDKTNEDCQNILTCAAKGKIHITKASTDPGISAGDTGYSLEGAEFTVARKDEPDKVLDRVTTDSKGNATTAELPFGDYILREAKAPWGFTAAGEDVSVTITGGPRFVTVEESPVYALVGKVLTKVDAETGESEPLGAGSLAGARFVISFFAGCADLKAIPASPTRTWTLVTDKDGSISLDQGHLVAAESDDLYLDHEGRPGLPLGTVTVREVSAPEGYLIPKVHEWSTVIVDTMAGKEVTLIPEATVRESAIRGDVSFDKVEAGTGRKMANVVFRVTSQTTKESHLIMTDGQGHFSSKGIAHSQATNGLDAAVDGKGNVVEGRLSRGCGTWFYGHLSGDGHTASKVDDNRGAFPYDTYTFEELSSPATLGHELVTFEVTVADNGATVSKGSIEDRVVSLETIARDGSDGDKYLAADSSSQTIVDKVEYEGLEPGAEYTLTCTLVDGTDGTPLKDGKGNTCVTSRAFTPTAESGTHEVEMAVSGLSSSTGRIVAFERLTRGGKLIASHEDIDDADQALFIPSIMTTLTDGDGGRTVPSDATCTLVDAIDYQGLIPGETYQIEGVLMDGGTGQALADASGQPIRSLATLTPTEVAGTTSVSFEVSTEGLADTSIVAFETLTQGDQVICSHADINDEQQTVNVVRNFASLPNTGSRGLPLVLSAGSILLGLGWAGRRLASLLNG